jgi:hypothetical protein
MCAIRKETHARYGPPGTGWRVVGGRADVVGRGGLATLSSSPPTAWATTDASSVSPWKPTAASAPPACVVVALATLRTGVERFNSRMDRVIGFEEQQQPKMETRVTLALIVMLAMALGRIRSAQADLMRSSPHPHVTPRETAPTERIAGGRAAT